MCSLLRRLVKINLSQYINLVLSLDNVSTLVKYGTSKYFTRFSCHYAQHLHTIFSEIFSPRLKFPEFDGGPAPDWLAQFNMAAKPKFSSTPASVIYAQSWPVPSTKSSSRRYPVKANRWRVILNLCLLIKDRWYFCIKIKSRQLVGLTL